MKNKVGKLKVAALLLFLVSCFPFTQLPDDPSWQPLFNGKNLDGWIPKFHHHEAGVNFGNTFRAEEGMIKVRYDQYGDFREQFGHLYY